MAQPRACWLLLLALAAPACRTESGPGGPAATSLGLSTLPPLTEVQPTGAAPAPPLPPPLASGMTICDTFAAPAAVGEVVSAELRETSGIAASRAHRGVLWAHNDSGDAAATYGLGTDGSDLGRFRLNNASALDWEDMAIGPGPVPGKDHLYLGDIGDNLRIRGDLTVYRIGEPEPGRPGDTVDGVETLRVTYGEADRGLDAEALAVDPVTGDLLVFTKGDGAGRSFVFRAATSDLAVDVITLLAPVTVLTLGENAEVTAADFTVEGGILALRGYGEVWMWLRTDVDLAVTLEAAPCLAPSPEEAQGEALAFAPDGSYYTIGEGARAPVHRVSPLAG